MSDTSRGAIIDAAVRDVEPDGPRILDAQREPEPDAKPDILDFAVPRGDALSACDEVGRRICVVEGERAVRVCEDTGFWRDSLCPAGSVCQGGACMEENEGCRTGERACLAQDRPGVCGEDGDFRAEAACVEGEVCAGGWCMSPTCAAATQTRSYLGCDYWAVDLPSRRYLGDPEATVNGAPLGLVIVNPDPELSVGLSVSDRAGIAEVLPRYEMRPPEGANLPEEVFAPVTLTSHIVDAEGMLVADGLERLDGVDLPPGGVATVLIPREARVLADSVIREAAYRLRTEHPVAAYQFNPLCCNYSFSNDASLLFPVSALGNRYRHLGPPGQGGQATTMAIVATVDGTEVSVQVPPEVVTARDAEGGLEPVDGRITTTLDAHEVLLLNSGVGPFPPSQRDLTGAVVETTGPVALFASHDCSEYPAGSSACDHLEEQVFPLHTWGRSFVLAPPVQRGIEPVWWKMVADLDQTRVILSRPYEELAAADPGNGGSPKCADFLTDPETLVLDAGEHCEFGTTEALALFANQPMLVMGVIAGQAATGVPPGHGQNAGDPALFAVPPDRQFRDNYAFLTPSTYANDFLTVVADADATILLDGEPVDLADAAPVPGSTRVYAHVELGDGAHRVEGDQNFGILVVAFDDFVSYAFTGGLNLEKE